IENAEKKFLEVDRNRAHLQPWLEWVDETKRIEDSLRHLFACESERKKGKKIEYGIYLKKKYIGNIGVFDISKKHKSAEIGYWLSKDFIGNGYMKEAVELVENYFFESSFLHRLQIKCDEKNLASAAVARACGYQLEGILRGESWNPYSQSFRNTCVFSKLVSDHK
ncbi:MAG: GNAT family N-acetyltransferase, partial [Nanoarchaeota archaeon]|nr:GNAT family N-acetyltransferase [Nanoarchaeota archaeon]